MAVMIVSASIPFSLASASIVCINGFCIVTLGLKLHFQAAARNPSQRQPVHTLPRSLEEHDRVSRGSPLDAAQTPLERLLVVHRLAHHDLREAAGEPPVVVLAAQRPIESRRRNLERVRGGQRVLDVEDDAHLAVHLLAILDADALLGRGRRPRPVDEHAHYLPLRFPAAHDVPHFETVRPRDTLSNRADVLQRLHSSAGRLKPAQYPQIKKVGTSPLGDFLRVAAVKNITRWRFASGSPPGLYLLVPSHATRGLTARPARPTRGL